MLGCVTKLDQILLYKPWMHHMLVQKAKMELAEAGLQTGSLKGKKRQIEDRDDDVKVFVGDDHKISSKDEVVADEAAIDADDGGGHLVGFVVLADGGNGQQRGSKQTHGGRRGEAGAEN